MGFLRKVLNQKIIVIHIGVVGEETDRWVCKFLDMMMTPQKMLLDFKPTVSMSD